MNPNPDASPTLARVDVTNPSLSSSSRRDLSVIIGALGNIKMCDPSFSPPDPIACP
jgi:hypothetical protein